MSALDVLTGPASMLRGQKPVAAAPIAAELAARNCRRETLIGSIMGDTPPNKVCPGHVAHVFIITVGGSSVNGGRGRGTGTEGWHAFRECSDAVNMSLPAQHADPLLRSLTACRPRRRPALGIARIADYIGVLC